MSFESYLGLERCWMVLAGILNLYIDFEDAENIHVLLVLIFGFEDTGGS